MNPVGKPDAGKPHVRFDERGRETWPCWPTRPSSTLLRSFRLTTPFSELLALQDREPRARSRDHRLRWSLLPQAFSLWSSVKVSFGHPGDEITTSDRTAPKGTALSRDHRLRWSLLPQAFGLWSSVKRARNDLMNDVG